MSGLALSLLGSPCLSRDGVALHLRSRKCLALLAYLAVTGVSHTRASLTLLLWPESDAKHAHNALRSTLSRLREPLGGAWLVVGRETIGLDGSQERTVDVVRFRNLLAECRAHGHTAHELCPDCLSLLAEAVDLYQGDFMAGFTLRGSPQFDDWQSLETEALRSELASALERLAEAYATQGDVDAGVAYAQRWLALDPLNEAAHRCLMRLYAGCGQQARALRQYQTVERLLSEELGVSPDAQTAELCQAIREGWTPHARGAFPTPHNLPPEPTPFVGREAELAQMAQLLAEPSCRLLSLVGPGGVGKTRLAIEVARDQVRRFSHGVHFVSLVSLRSPELLSSTILDALDVPPSRNLHPEEQILNILADKQLLLILDNFEHLLDGTRLVTAILGHCSRLKLLVTSRERLSIRDEWLLPLGGLPFPDEEEIQRTKEQESVAVWPGVASEESVAALGSYNAIRLFVQCARRVRPDFSLATAGASSVARICQLLEGMPLAIELAAPWVRVMPCREIARQIEGGLSLLTTTLRDMPQRHRSMRAVFDHSWDLLSAHERSVLRPLSVFRGGFRQEAAEDVAGASLALLSSLVDSSWLRAAPSGRYDMHELIRQYCAEELNARPVQEGQRESEWVRDRHSRYYAAFLQEREPHLFGRRQKEAFEEILENMDNVRAAWDWATERGHIQTIGKCVAALEEVAELRGWHYEVNQALDRAATKLREQLDVAKGRRAGATPAETRTILAEILRSQATECFRLGLLEWARMLCEEGLALLRHAGHGPRQRKATARAKGFLGWLLWEQGDYVKGNQLLRQALGLYEEVGFSRGRVAVLMLMAAHPHHLGRYEEAEEFLQQATALASEAGDLRYHAWCLTNLSEVLRDKGECDRAGRAVEESFQIRQQIADRAGTADSLLRLAAIATALGHYELARKHYQDSLLLADEVGDLNHKYSALSGLGRVAAALGHDAEAKDWLEESLALAKRMGHPVAMSQALVGLGHATCAVGEVSRSRQCFCQALEVAMKAQRMLEALDALVGLAHLSAREGAPERAVGLLALAFHHPATRQATRDGAQELLLKLASELPSEVFAEATARGQARELEEVVAEILGDYNCSESISSRTAAMISSS